MIKYYTVYKVTNKINGKVYIGVHKTSDLNDDYMGSGKYLKYSQNKHGIECFEKEILHVFDNPEEMFAKEKELVNEEFIAETNTYNLKIGGFGGWDHINSDPISKSKTSRQGGLNSTAVMKVLRENDAELLVEFSKAISRSMIKQYADGTRKPRKPHVVGEFKHTDESKRKISEARKGNGMGSNNSNAKSVMDDAGNIFGTVSECAEHNEISTETVRRRVKSGVYNFI
jgi:hypothetical protein